MKEKRRSSCLNITCSLLCARSLYERHVGEMPPNMPYIEALETLVLNFGAHRAKMMILDFESESG